MNIKNGKTYGNVARISYGINSFFAQIMDNICFENLPKLDDEGGMGKNDDYCYPLQEIAWINVKKEAKKEGKNQNKSNQTEIDAEYNNSEVKKIIESQIKYINPNIIIIACGIVKLAEDISGVNFLEFKNTDDKQISKYYFDTKSKKLFIYTKHPNCGQARITNQDYCNSILKLVMNIYA